MSRAIQEYHHSDPGTPPYRPECRGIIVAYDLADPDGWDAALQARRIWGKECSRVEVLDLDHIAIVFLPGAARRLAG
jgi:hypothetical protein